MIQQTVQIRMGQDFDAALKFGIAFNYPEIWFDIEIVMILLISRKVK